MEILTYFIHFASFFIVFLRFHSYNDLDEGGSKILGLLVTQQNTSYGFSEAKKVTLLSPEKELKLTDLLKQHFHQQPHQQPSYFLIASCS